jgi:glutathione S-transferase
MLIVSEQDHQEEWEKAVSTMKEEWKLWDKHLEGKQYLAGSQFSVADIAVYVLFALLARIGKDWSKDTEFPK